MPLGLSMQSMITLLAFPLCNVLRLQSWHMKERLCDTPSCTIAH